MRGKPYSTPSPSLLLPRVLLSAVCLTLLGTGCASVHREIRSNALDFLYPKGVEARPPTDVTLTIPVRVGIAFPPVRQSSWEDTFTEDRKQVLLERIAAAFRGRPEIADVQVIPSVYLQPEGGFANLDRIAASFGIDLVALVSYDQHQFSNSGTSSILYWTLIGAYVVKGEKNEIRTQLGAAVFDIESRMMLFTAGGQSSVGGRSTPIKIETTLRGLSDEGFRAATDDLIVNLDAALDLFKDQAQAGTVRGAGTPAVAVVDATTGAPISEGGDSGGAVAGIELLALVLLLACAWMARGGSPR
jgi:rhombotail lipoprotein